MNKIVLEHYPVSRLPDDLREAVGDAKEVTLTIEAEEQTRITPPARQAAMIGFQNTNIFVVKILKRSTKSMTTFGL